MVKDTQAHVMEQGGMAFELHIYKKVPSLIVPSALKPFDPRKCDPSSSMILVLMHESVMHASMIQGPLSVAEGL